jgi:hypothetical protein
MRLSEINHAFTVLGNVDALPRQLVRCLQPLNLATGLDARCAWSRENLTLDTVLLKQPCCDLPPLNGKGVAGQVGGAM